MFASSRVCAPVLPAAHRPSADREFPPEENPWRRAHAVINPKPSPAGKVSAPADTARPQSGNAAQMNGDVIAEAMMERPHGYVFKHDSLEELLEALQAVRRGCKHFTPMAASFPDSVRLGTNAWDTLSGQERTVLQMVTEGASSKEVASRLGISSKTVDYHRAQVMQKLELRDVTALTRYAMRRGLVALE